MQHNFMTILKDAAGMTMALALLLLPVSVFILAIMFAIAIGLNLMTPCSAAEIGQLSTNRWLYNSTSNPYGPYGSKWTYGSVNNPYGPNGSPWSASSATNPYAIDPPTIESSGIYEGYE